MEIEMRNYYPGMWRSFLILISKQFKIVYKYMLITGNNGFIMFSHMYLMYMSEKARH